MYDISFLNINAKANKNILNTDSQYKVKDTFLTTRVPSILQKLLSYKSKGTMSLWYHKYVSYNVQHFVHCGMYHLEDVYCNCTGKKELFIVPN